MNCNPSTTVRMFEGMFIYNAQFFNDDPFGDVILSGNVAIKALDVISLKHKQVIIITHFNLYYLIF